MTTDKVDLQKAPGIRRRVSMPVAYLVVMPVLCLVVLVGGCVLYVKHVDNQRARTTERLDRAREAERVDSDRAWCALLSPLDRAYSASTPTTDIGRQVAAAIHALRIQKGCEE